MYWNIFRPMEEVFHHTFRSIETILAQVTPELFWVFSVAGLLLLGYEFRSVQGDRKLTDWMNSTYLTTWSSLHVRARENHSFITLVIAVFTFLVCISGENSSIKDFVFKIAILTPPTFLLVLLVKCENPLAAFKTRATRQKTPREIANLVEKDLISLWQEKSK